MKKAAALAALVALSASLGGAPAPSGLFLVAQKGDRLIDAGPSVDGLAWAPAAR